MKEKVLVPNRAVARRLKVPYLSLESFARTLLLGQGLEVVSPFRARRLLVQAGLFGEEGVEEKAQGSLVGEGGEGLGQEREEASHPRFAHR
ncbi:hypothetical protein, partial [Meiothermus luteus]|uniref:hypothetical protein n=1 Tax=Meiothermus luteus TaxID=2026184 RepID=UPI0015FC1EA3